MWTEYFITVAFLVVSYFCLRWTFLALLEFFASPHDYVQPAGKGIETGKLCERVHHLRTELTQARMPSKSSGFKRALRVQSKRAQIANMAYFQTLPPPKPETPDQEHGSHLLLV